VPDSERKTDEKWTDTLFTCGVGMSAALADGRPAEHERWERFGGTCKGYFINNDRHFILILQHQTTYSIKAINAANIKI